MSTANLFVETSRFEDCQAAHGREFQRLWAASADNKKGIEELRKIVYQNKGAAYVIHGLIGLVSSAAGVALIKGFFTN